METQTVGKIQKASTGFQLKRTLLHEILCGTGYVYVKNSKSCKIAMYISLHLISTVCHDCRISNLKVLFFQISDTYTKNRCLVVDHRFKQPSSQRTIKWNIICFTFKQRLEIFFLLSFLPLICPSKSLFLCSCHIQDNPVYGTVSTVL